MTKLPKTKIILTAAILFFGLFGMTKASQAATNHFVRAGSSCGTGSGCGGDWTNAYTDLPSTLVRGDTYYVAGGSYATHTFNDSGSLIITIKKATIADHGTTGTAGGWSDSYGTSQAIFTAPLTFSAGYYMFSGSYRNESNWFDNTAYGFEIANAAGNTNPTVYLYGSYNNIYFTAMVNLVQGSAATRSYVIDYEGPSVNYGSVVSHSLTMNGSNHYFLRMADGCVVEYCGATGSGSNANNHGEIVNLYGMYGRSNNIHIRYNIFKDNFMGSNWGTAVIANAGDTGNMIYGNLFINNGTTDGTIGWNGTSADHAVHNLLIYNNSFINGRGYASGIMLDTLSTGCVAYNNIWSGGNGSNFQGITNAYNANVPTSQFVNYSGGNFHLASHTAAGNSSLASPFNYDMDGTLRGSTGGIWDEGAYQYVSGGGGDTTPPAAPTGLAVT